MQRTLKLMSQGATHSCHGCIQLLLLLLLMLLLQCLMCCIVAIKLCRDSSTYWLSLSHKIMLQSLLTSTNQLRVGRIQHERLAGQEQRSDQRVCSATDAVVQGTACSHILQGTRRRSVSNVIIEPSLTLGQTG